MANLPRKRQTRKVATTRSTAGPGYAFEDLVAADILSQWLLDMPIDGLSVSGDRLLFQASAAGWQIDDLICVGLTAAGEDRRLALSCKSSVQVRRTGWPRDFISAAWALWRQEDPFRRSVDHVGLVTRGRNSAFDAVWFDLKTWCEGADAEVALSRINQSATHRQMFDTVRKPGAQDGVIPSDEETVLLITSLDIHPTDFQLTRSTSLREAKRRCRAALVSEDPAEAGQLWDDLVQTAGTARLGNGVVRLADLIRALSTHFALKAHPSIAGSLQRLLAISGDQRATIETSLPNGHKITRKDEADRFEEMAKAYAGCLVLGESGSGKSALVLDGLDKAFSGAAQLWLGPEELGAALSAARRRSIGLEQDLAFVLDRMTGPEKLLVLDSAERLEDAHLLQLEALLAALAADSTWGVVITCQPAGLSDRLRSIGPVRDWPVVPVSGLPNSAVRGALRSVPTLQWIANDADLLPLLSNLKTLGWVIGASSSFGEGGQAALTSTAAIADRLWARWTDGPAKTQLQRLLVSFAVRDADFERSFAISDLDAGDAAAFDQRSGELPLVVNTQNRIEFGHDLASDWARYQRLKEIADDIPAWSALASQPLWIGAIRLLGQHLLGGADQAREGWDHAFGIVTAAGNVEAGDLLLDALCSDPHLDRHLAARAELMFAEDGKWLRRLLHRFLHLATVPSFPGHLPVEEGLRIYLEADMRFPIMGRWAPIGRFLSANVERVGDLGAPIVSRLCKAWLSSLPVMLGGEPMPLRDVIAAVALATARTRQVESMARRRWGSSDEDRLIYTVALAGAPDLGKEVAAFALEMVGRRSSGDETLARIEALREKDRARARALAEASPPRPRRTPPASFISSIEHLPPWPLGPNERLIGAFRVAVLNGALSPMMETDPATASEVLLACIIEEDPIRDSGRSMRREDLGLQFDQQSYPTIFWNSPFFLFLTVNPEAALAALKQLLDFVLERAAAEAPRKARRSALKVRLADGTTRSFLGSARQFGWSQENSSENGQLFSALDALSGGWSSSLNAVRTSGHGASGCSTLRAQRRSSASSSTSANTSLRCSRVRCVR